MLGNVFSPAYARARARRGDACPLDHATFNVALYRPRAAGGNAWALTEHGRRHVDVGADALRVGRSRMAVRGDRLVVELDEARAPAGGRIRGQVSVSLPSSGDGDGGDPAPVALDGVGRHLWWPIAPRVRVSVELASPAIRFEGTGYLDANAGDRGLEHDFASWAWSRVALPSGQVALAYDVRTRRGDELAHGFRLDPSGLRRPLDGTTFHDLGRSVFRLPRRARSDAGAPSTLARTLEDTPFYARSEIEATIGGERGHGVHEVVDLDRFASPWVQFLLPFRMRREP